ncbi:hypothetical protein V6Z96_005577 [Aspergillus fumigatus]
MLYQLIYWPMNVPFIDARHDEVVPARISTSTPAPLIGLTQTENSQMPLYSGFLRRIFSMRRRSWMGMKAEARTLEPQRVRPNRRGAISSRILCILSQWLVVRRT